MRIRRKLLGLTQRQVAEQMGLTFQLVQKYESGATRISASRLYEISGLLDVPISNFFEESDPGAPQTAETAIERAQQLGAPELANAILDLLRSYYGIPDPSLRRRLLTLIRRQDRARSEPELDEAC